MTAGVKTQAQSVQYLVHAIRSVNFAPFEPVYFGPEAHLIPQDPTLRCGSTGRQQYKTRHSKVAEWYKLAGHRFRLRQYQPPPYALLPRTLVPPPGPATRGYPPTRLLRPLRILGYA
eukprot:3161290-Rhodomonas_salina.1